MDSVIRKGIAFLPEELERFDELIKEKGYKNRSEAVRDLIRNELSKKAEHDPNKKMHGVLTIVYDHHNHSVQHNLTHIQHYAAAHVISSMHTHLDEHNCLEIIVMKGKVRVIKKLADTILAMKGVTHGKLVLTG